MSSTILISRLVVGQSITVPQPPRLRQQAPVVAVARLPPSSAVAVAVAAPPPRRGRLTTGPRAAAAAALWSMGAGLLGREAPPSSRATPTAKAAGGGSTVGHLMNNDDDTDMCSLKASHSLLLWAIGYLLNELSDDIIKDDNEAIMYKISLKNYSLIIFGGYFKHDNNKESSWAKGYAEHLLFAGKTAMELFKKFNLLTDAADRQRYESLITRLGNTYEQYDFEGSNGLEHYRLKIGPKDTLEVTDMIKYLTERIIKMKKKRGATE